MTIYVEMITLQVPKREESQRKTVRNGGIANSRKEEPRKFALDIERVRDRYRITHHIYDL